MISELEYDKAYYFLPKNNEVGGVGFVKIIEADDAEVKYKMVANYVNLHIEKPIFDKSTDVAIGYNTLKYLKERLYEIKDIKTFPMCMHLSNGDYVVCGPNGKYLRAWRLHLLLEES